MNQQWENTSELGLGETVAHRSGDCRKQRWYLPTSLLKKRWYLPKRLLWKPLLEACTFGGVKSIAADTKAVYALKQRLNRKQLRVTNHFFACNLPIRRADAQKVGYRFFPIAFFLALSFFNASLIKHTFESPVMFGLLLVYSIFKQTFYCFIFFFICIYRTTAMSNAQRKNRMSYTHRWTLGQSHFS